MKYDGEMKWNCKIKWKQNDMEWDYEFADSELQMNVAFCHYLLHKGNGKCRMSEISDFHPVFSV